MLILYMIGSLPTSGQIKDLPNKDLRISKTEQSFKKGLTVRNGALYLRDRPFRGIGVNYFDVFLRVLQDPCDRSYREGFQLLAKYQIPFVRFNAGGFWPNEWNVYLNDPNTYFRRLDQIIQTAEKNHIGLIPSLFWLLSTVPDLVDESCDQWGNPNSRTHALMRRYVRDVVMRYRNSEAIWGWEFGNEYNLQADLPNAAQHRPPVAPSLGTPRRRSERDEITREIMRLAVRSFAREIRRYDPDRIILSGNSFPRWSAWHQMKDKSWQRDTPSQTALILAADHPDPLDTLCIHLYEQPEQKIPLAMNVATQQRKPLIVGEFGAKGMTSETRRDFLVLLAWLEKEQVPLAAVWVFDYRRQFEWNITADHARAYQLEAIREVNKRLSNLTRQKRGE